MHSEQTKYERGSVTGSVSMNSGACKNMSIKVQVAEEASPATIIIEYKISS